MIYNTFLVDNYIFLGLNIGILSALAYISTFKGILTIVVKNPIHSVMFLIALFLSVSLNLFSLGVDFIGFAYLLVYVGAVSILFLFILMLINIRISELYSGSYNNITLSFLILLALWLSKDKFIPKMYSLGKIYIATSIEWAGSLTEFTQIASIGNIMYSIVVMWFFLVALILLLAMVGAIIITIRPNDTNITSFQMSLVGGSSKKPNSSSSRESGSDDCPSLTFSGDSPEDDEGDGNNQENEPSNTLNNQRNEPSNTRQINLNNIIFEDGLDHMPLSDDSSDDSSYDGLGHVPSRNEGAFFPRELEENETPYDSPDTQERDWVDPTPSDEGYNADGSNNGIDEAENQFYWDKSEEKRIERDNAVAEGNFEEARIKNKEYIRASRHIEWTPSPPVCDPNDNDLNTNSALSEKKEVKSGVYNTDSYTSDLDLQWLREEREMSIYRKNFDRAQEYDKQIKAYKEKNKPEVESEIESNGPEVESNRLEVEPEVESNGPEVESMPTILRRPLYDPNNDDDLYTNPSSGEEENVVAGNAESSATAAARIGTGENVTSDNPRGFAENVVSADTTESSENVTADNPRDSDENIELDNAAEYTENEARSRDKGKGKADFGDSFDYPSKKFKRVSLENYDLEGLDHNRIDNNGYAYKDYNYEFLSDIARFIEYLLDNYIIILSNIEIYPLLPIFIILFKNTYFYRRIKNYLIRKVKSFFFRWFF